MMQNYMLTLSYDGTDFHGWQRQPQIRTVQGVIESSLAKITRKMINVIGAGRTDAGVHALEQVASFKAILKMEEEELFAALNSILPDDARVTSLKKVDVNFHARKMAASKVYQYRIFNSPYISPFISRYVLHRPSPLDVDLMKRAALLFVREADFRAFSSDRLLEPVRKVMRSEIEKKGEEIIYTVEANGFLRYMVRTMVGTLLEVGRGKMRPEKIEEIFREKKRTLFSPTAPAKGLCLIKVNY
jgi:tRNA pseudouridine38-40 synthase